MKKFAVYLSLVFMTALLWKDLAALSWNVWFYSNQIELANKYCVNKAKPMLHCDGKCYLAKKLQKLEQEEQSKKPVPRIPMKLKESSYTFIGIKSLVYLCADLGVDSEKMFAIYHRTYSFSPTNTIFHPPQI